MCEQGPCACVAVDELLPSHWDVHRRTWHVEFQGYFFTSGVTIIGYSVTFGPFEFSIADNETGTRHPSVRQAIRDMRKWAKLAKRPRSRPLILGRPEQNWTQLQGEAWKHRGRR